MLVNVLKDLDTIVQSDGAPRQDVPL